MAHWRLQRYMWRFASLFTSEAKTLKDLRKHADGKLSQYYPEGVFRFTLECKDKQPVLLISKGKDEVLREAYLKLSESLKSDASFVEGIYKSKKGDATTSTFEFEPFPEYLTGAKGVTDKDWRFDPKKNKDGEKNRKQLEQVADKKKVLYDKIVKDPTFENRLRGCLGVAGPSIVKWNGRVVGLASDKDKEEWVVTDWNMTRVLCGGSEKSAWGKKTVRADLDPLAGTWFLDAQNKPVKFVTKKGGLVFPPTWSCKVIVFGPIVEKAAEGDGTMAAKWREAAVEPFQKGELGKQLFLDIKKIDEEAEKEAAPNKPSSTKKLEARIEKFIKDYEEVVLEKIGEQWFEYIQDHVELKAYDFDCKVDMAKNAVTFAVGTVAAGFGGLTGIGAILGVVGCIKSGLDLSRDIARYTATIHAIEDRLGKDVIRTYEEYVKTQNSPGWQEVGKTLLERIPGAGLAADVMKLPVKSVDAMKKDLNAFKAKTTELYATIEKAGKTLEASRKVAEKCNKDFDAMIASKAQAELLREYLKGHLDKLIADKKLVIKAFEDSFDNVGKALKEHERCKNLGKSWTDMIDQIDKKVPVEAKIGIALVKAIDIVWGCDPANMANTGQAIASTAMDVLADCSVAFEGIKDWGNVKESEGYSKVLNDLVNGLRQIHDNVKTWKVGG